MNKLKLFLLNVLTLLMMSIFFPTPEIWAQNEGPWRGISNSGGEIHFQVVGSNVEGFWIEAYLTGGSAGYGWLELAIDPVVPINGSSFSFHGSFFDVEGFFSSSSTCSGTYDYHDSYLGYSSGTWTANLLTAPEITLSPTSNDFGERMYGTSSNDVKFTLKNIGAGIATGSVFLTGTNADQFEITNGLGSFSLGYGQSKDVYVRFSPKSQGLKTAVLMADGDYPCNDASAYLEGAGTYPVLAVSPDYQMVPEVAGSTVFNVSNAGASSSVLSWTAEVNPSDGWLKITSGTSGTNRGAISVDYDTNPGDTRIGSITVTADGASDSPQTVEVLQSANRSLKMIAADGEPGDSFGCSVSISGDYAIVGACGDDDNGSDSGSAYIFVRTGGGWIQQSKLKADDGAAGDYFGYSVSISGDYVIVGAYGDDDNGSDSGSAYIFERTGGEWIQRATLKAGDGAAGDNFGYSVSISGDHAIVGASADDDNGYNSGSAYIFKKPLVGWTDMTETAKLTASDGYGHYDLWVPAFDAFGSSVSISEDYAIVGACAFRRYGSAYIFKRPENGWTSMTETAKLTTSDQGTTSSIGGFGRSVIISEGIALVGADNSLAGANTQSGRVYIYEKPSNGWENMTETAKFNASDGGNSWKNSFGFSLGMSDDSVVVGARWDKENGTKSGSAYMFKRPLSGWEDTTETAKLTANDGVSDDNFGSSVSMCGDYVIIGTPGDDDNGANSGSILFYFTGNFAPTILDIKDHIIHKNTTLNALSFKIFDSETLPENLLLTGVSSNSTLVPNENIVFGGTGVNRTITITPAPNATGKTTITVTLSGDIETVSDSFLLTVIKGKEDIDLSDAILALQIITGIAPLDTSSTFDITGDGRVGLREAVYIIQEIAGLRQ